jgi:hypothetical protein
MPDHRLLRRYDLAQRLHHRGATRDARLVGKAMARGVGRKTIFLIALAVSPVRGVLFSFIDFPVGVVAIQLLVAEDRPDEAFVRAEA